MGPPCCAVQNASRRGAGAHGTFVPVRARIARSAPGRMSRIDGRTDRCSSAESDSRPLRHTLRRRPARLGRSRARARRWSRPPTGSPISSTTGRARSGGTGSVLRRPLPLRALRRARLRHDRLGRRRPVARALGRRPRDGRRGRRPERAVRAARHLAGRGGLHRLRGAPSRSASRAWCSTAATRAARAARRPRRASGSTEAIIELARLAGAATTRPSARSSRRASSRTAPTSRCDWFNELCRKTTSPRHRGARSCEARGADRRHRAARRRCATPTLVLHARDDASCRSPRDACSPRESRARSSSSSTRGTTCCWSTSRPGSASARPCSTFTRHGARRPDDPAFASLSRARARDPDAAHRRPEQRRDRRAARHQREDRAQPRLQCLRQARRLDARAGHRLRPRSRFHGLRRAVNSSSGTRGACSCSATRSAAPSCSTRCSTSFRRAQCSSSWDARTSDRSSAQPLEALLRGLCARASLSQSSAVLSQKPVAPRAKGARRAEMRAAERIAEVVGVARIEEVQSPEARTLARSASALPDRHVAEQSTRPFAALTRPRSKSTSSAPGRSAQLLAASSSLRSIGVPLSYRNVSGHETRRAHGCPGHCRRRATTSWS